MTRYFKYNGKKLNITDISRRSGVPYSTLLRHLRFEDTGSDVTEMVYELLARPRTKEYVYRGKVRTVYEISQISGCDYRLLYRYFSDAEVGSDVTELVDIRFRVYVYEGCRWKLNDLCGVINRTVMDLCEVLREVPEGSDITELVCKRPKKRRYTYRGELLSMAAISRKSGISYWALRNAIISKPTGADVTERVEKMRSQAIR